jgi:adenine-specific DNA-methyltransferase
MIATFPSRDLKFETIPAPIQRHLQKYREALEPKPRDWRGQNGKGEKGTYQWFETQDPISIPRGFPQAEDHLSEHDEVLAVLPGHGDHFFINDKAFILTSEAESLPYLAAALNSCCSVAASKTTSLN